MPAKGSGRAAWDAWLLQSPQVRVLVEMAKAAYFDAGERASVKFGIHRRFNTQNMRADDPAQQQPFRAFTYPLPNTLILDWFAEKAWEEGEYAAAQLLFGRRRPAKARKHGRALRSRLLDREPAPIP